MRPIKWIIIWINWLIPIIAIFPTSFPYNHFHLGFTFILLRSLLLNQIMKSFIFRITTYMKKQHSPQRFLIICVNVQFINKSKIRIFELLFLWVQMIISEHIDLWLHTPVVAACIFGHWRWVSIDCCYVWLFVWRILFHFNLILFS